MKCLDLTLCSPAENLALDEALLEYCESRRTCEVLRFWESDSHFVVLGAGCAAREDAHTLECKEDKIPVLRRCSGGGTVLQGPGCLNYALALGKSKHPELETIQGANRYVLSRMCHALAGMLPGIAHKGLCDLCVGDTKVSGNAQKRKRHSVLYHGTVLHHFKLKLITQYLKEPERQPQYREQRSHADFLVNSRMDPDEIKSRVRSVWHADEDTDEWPRELVESLVTTKYSRHDWNLWR